MSHTFQLQFNYVTFSNSNDSCLEYMICVLGVYDMCKSDMCLFCEACVGTEIFILE